MPLQMRPYGGTGRAYSPNRDVAWVFAQATQLALDSMAETDWEDWYGDYLRHCQMTEEDLGKVAECMGNFCKTTIEEVELKTPFEVLEKSGFFDAPYPAQLAVMAKLGQVFMGIYFAGVRDAMRTDDATPIEVEELCKAGKDIAERFKSPRRDDDQPSNSN